MNVKFIFRVSTSSSLSYINDVTRICKQVIAFSLFCLCETGN